MLASQALLVDDVGMFELRRYEDADAAVVWRLHEAGLRQTNSHAGDGPWDDDLRAVRRSYLDSGGEFLIATSNGEAVGMGAIRRSSSGTAEVKRMRVDQRFQRQGIGRMILERLIERATELGYGTLRLDTTTTQLPAQRLYLSSGFEEVERSIGPDGHGIIIFQLELRHPGRRSSE